MKKVIVNRTTRYNKRGIPELVATPDKVYGVAAVLMGGKVRTTSGDVWSVLPYGGPEADFKTCEPCG